MVLCAPLCSQCASTPDQEEGLDDRLVEKMGEVATKIDQVAEKIDIYAANDRYVDGPNESRVVLYNAFSLKEGGQRSYSPHVGAHLHLPNLQRKLQLSFTSYDPDSAERGINESRYRSKPEERTFATSLVLFQELGNIRTEFRPLLEYRDDELQTSYLFKFWSEAKVGSFFVEPELQFFARSDTGTGQFVAFNLVYQWNEVNALTLLNEEQYTDGDNTASTNHGIKWAHVYNPVMSFENALVFESNNRPIYHLDRYIYNFMFSHQLRKNAFHYRASPNLSFERARRFHPLAGIDFRLEVIF